MKYIINKNKIIEELKLLNKKFSVFYPVKANSNLSVLRMIDSFVDGYEVDSLHHINKLLKKIDVSPDRVLYSYPLKTKREISQAICMGIKKFAVDNLAECNNIIAANDNNSCFIIRVDVTDYIDEGNLIKWGASSNEIPLIIESIEKSGNKLLGFSFYLPQEIVGAENFESVVLALDKRYNLKQYDVLDIGGGYSNNMLLKVQEILFNNLKLATTRVIIEQGRFLLDPAIDMLVTIIGVREKKGIKLVFVDSGIYHGLLDVIIKEKHFQIDLIGRTSLTTELQTYLVCGDTSDISDTIGFYDLPADIKVGDKLLIHNCGAYCEELITAFSPTKRANHKVDSVEL